MASGLRQMGSATIRPHYEAHKSPDLAWRQVQAGAGGLSMATVWEAVVLADAGIRGSPDSPGNGTDAARSRNGSREGGGGLQIDRVAAARLQDELEHRRGVQGVELDG